MNVELETIELENEKTYAIIDKINYNNCEYYYLSNIEDNKDFCIRKKEIENDEEFLIGLENDKEFDDVLAIFMEKYKK
jgi:hypothetical protein